MVSGVTHPAFAAVEAVNAALDELAGAALWSLPAADAARLVVEVEKVSRRVTSAQMTVLAQANSVAVRTLTGARTTPLWLRAAADVPVWAGKNRLGLHQQLAGRPLAAAALAAGEVSVEAATAVCAALDGLPAAVPAVQVGSVEQLLVDVAVADGAAAVAKWATRITQQWAPDLLDQREAAARDGRFLSLTTARDGTVGLSGRFDQEGGALLTAVLGALAAPAPAVDGIPDSRDAGARWADALLQLCQHATPDLPLVRGERPNVLLTISLETLRDGLTGLDPPAGTGAGRGGTGGGGVFAGLPPAPGRTGGAGLLAGGVAISPETARKILCDANIIPVVCAGDSEVLDVGRATRTIPVGIRRALVVRDQGCVFPGCDRPPSWTDAHHLVYWSDGGPTCLTNLCLLCRHHHEVIHHDGWQIVIHHRLPWFIPPPSIDPNQTPLQHPRHRTPNP